MEVEGEQEIIDNAITNDTFSEASVGNPLQDSIIDNDMVHILAIIKIKSGISI